MGNPLLQCSHWLFRGRRIRYSPIWAYCGVGFRSPNLSATFATPLRMPELMVACKSIQPKFQDSFLSARTTIRSGSYERQPQVTLDCGWNPCRRGQLDPPIEQPIDATSDTKG